MQKKIIHLILVSLTLLFCIGVFLYKKNRIYGINDYNDLQKYLLKAGVFEDIELRIAINSIITMCMYENDIEDGYILTDCAKDIINGKTHKEIIEYANSLKHTNYYLKKLLKRKYNIDVNIPDDGM